jgi:UDP:flavonoid glycosyltransferase YjiC (YdhE family)
MASKRVLLAAELPRGAATVRRLLPIAASLTRRGHDVTLALPDEFPSIPGFTIRPMPAWKTPPPPGFVAVNYSDVLQVSGYATPAALAEVLDPWRALIEQVQPDLAVTDFAPSAMLAARIAKVRQAAVGDGYSLPPLARPMPLLRPWADTPPGDAADADGRVLAVIEASLMGFGLPGLRSMRDLFRDVPRFLSAFPELDHYPDRGEAKYFGEVLAARAGPVPDWPAGDGERVFVDLHPRHPAVGPLIDVLDRLGLPSLVQGGAMTDALAERIAKPGVTVATCRNLPPVLDACNIVVCQGGEVAVQALLRGKPLLMLPVFVEEMMTLHRVATQGMGHGISPDADAPAIDAALRRLVDDSACRTRAAAFARSYEGFDPAEVVEAIADGLEDLLT